MYRVSTSPKYFRNAETGCPSDTVRARERSLRKHFRPFRTRLSALRPQRTRALDGCIDHPKCKLPTQKYNSHAVGTRPTPKHDISKCNVKIAMSLIVSCAYINKHCSRSCAIVSRAKYKYFRRTKIITDQ